MSPGCFPRIIHIIFKAVYIVVCLSLENLLMILYHSEREQASYPGSCGASLLQVSVFAWLGMKQDERISSQLEVWN
jgi:hypothetical protein